MTACTPSPQGMVHTTPEDVLASSKVMPAEMNVHLQQGEGQVKAMPGVTVLSIFTDSTHDARIRSMSKSALSAAKVRTHCLSTVTPENDRSKSLKTTSAPRARNSSCSLSRNLSLTPSDISPASCLQNQCQITSLLRGLCS